uniref:Uncharacterized protein n=1 Tax=Anguilla anguilla TaxID=7936 RepID=A0A0E9UBC7_ANGAN
MSTTSHQFVFHSVVIFACGIYCLLQATILQLALDNCSVSIGLLWVQIHQSAR